jgi:hypothetical protein
MAFYLIRAETGSTEIFPGFGTGRKLPGLLARSKTLPPVLVGAGQGATSFVYSLTDGRCFGYDYNKNKVILKRTGSCSTTKILNLVSNALGEFLCFHQPMFAKWREVWWGAKNKTGNTDLFHDSVGYCISTNKKW